MILRRTWSFAIFCLLGCGPDEVPISDTAIGSDSDSGSDSDTTGTSPDMAGQGACPSGLGEAVTCECAVFDECVIEDENASNCAFGCEDVPSPCPTVECSFDGGTSGGACETNLDVAALQCVFDALADGQPMRWSTRELDTYMADGTGALRVSMTFLRLDATTYVLHAESHPNPHLMEGDDSWLFWGFEIPEAAWMECEALAVDTERFECLHELAQSGVPCVDPSALICP